MVDVSDVRVSRLCSFWSIVSMTMGLMLYAWHASQMICEAGFCAPSVSGVRFTLADWNSS